MTDDGGQTGISASAHSLIRRLSSVVCHPEAEPPVARRLPLRESFNHSMADREGTDPGGYDHRSLGQSRRRRRHLGEARQL